MAEEIDELIMRYIRVKSKKEKKINIYDDLVKIGNRFYKFTQWSLLEDLFQIYLPTTFEIIFDKKKKQKTNDDMPEFIITNSKDVSLSLKLFKNFDVDTVKEFIKNLLSKCETNVLISEGFEEAADKLVEFIDYKITPGFEDIYVFIFFTKLNKDVVMGTFTCYFKDYKQWNEALLQIIKTIK